MLAKVGSDRRPSPRFLCIPACERSLDPKVKGMSVS